MKVAVRRPLTIIVYRRPVLMRIVVMSDSHRQYGPLQKIMEQQPDADMYIHLGDSEGGIELLKANYPDKKFFFVAGNCDSDISLPGFLVIPADSGHRIFAAHGHRHAVRYSNAMILEAALENRCDIVCFGHTHERVNTWESGVHILNPGSCACPRDGFPPSYAYIDTVGDGVFKAHVDIGKF